MQAPSWSKGVASTLHAFFAADYMVNGQVLDRTELSGLFDYRQAVPDVALAYSGHVDSFLNMLSVVGLNWKLQRAGREHGDRQG
jgi:hypothetical protein